MSEATILTSRRTAKQKNWKLAHNHVMHHANMQHSVNGFRRFWISPQLTRRKRNPFVVCPCGWRPDLGVHYAIKSHAKHWRCEMFEVEYAKALERGEDMDR
jgi:hypothetical protein